MAPTFVELPEGSLPQGALCALSSHEATTGSLYVARVNHEGNVTPGKFHDTLRTAYRPYIPYMGEEYCYKDNYEVQPL